MSLTVGVAETLLAASLLLGDGLDEAGRLARVTATVEVLGNDTELVVMARRQAFDRTVCEPAV